MVITGITSQHILNHAGGGSGRTSTQPVNRWPLQRTTNFFHLAVCTFFFLPWKSYLEHIAHVTAAQTRVHFKEPGCRCESESYKRNFKAKHKSCSFIPLFRDAAEGFNCTMCPFALEIHLVFEVLFKVVFQHLCFQWRYILIKFQWKILFFVPCFHLTAIWELLIAFQVSILFVDLFGGWRLFGTYYSKMFGYFYFHWFFLVCDLFQNPVWLLVTFQKLDHGDILPSKLLTWINFLHRGGYVFIRLPLSVSKGFSKNHWIDYHEI